MVDAHLLSVPGSSMVQLTGGCSPLTWSTTISPPASWVQLTPASGALGYRESQPVQISVDPTELGDAYGEYTAQIQFTSTDLEVTVDIYLYYVPQIYQLFVPLLHRP